MKTMRLSTVIKKCGIPAYVDGVSRFKYRYQSEAFMHAVLNRKILTVHHGETSRQASWAEPGKHAVNTLGFLVFSKPIPESVTLVNGVDSQLGKIMELNKLLR